MPYLELDLPDAVEKKITCCLQNPQLLDKLVPLVFKDKHRLESGRGYSLRSADLCDLRQVQTALEEATRRDLQTLVLLECVLGYMEGAQAIQLIRYAVCAPVYSQHVIIIIILTKMQSDLTGLSFSFLSSWLFESFTSITLVVFDFTNPWDAFGHEILKVT